MGLVVRPHSRAGCYESTPPAAQSIKPCRMPEHYHTCGELELRLELAAIGN